MRRARRARRASATAAALLALFAGCGERPGPEGAAQDGEVSARAPTFEDEYQRVLALEEDARFTQALARLRATQKRFSGHPNAGVLAEAEARIRHERRASLVLPSAVKELGSVSAEVVAAAGKKLVKAGRAGRIFLRKAVLEEDGKIAIEGARLLVELGELGDRRAPGALAESESSRLSARYPLMKRLESGPPEVLRSVFARGLAALAEEGAPDPVLREFYELVRDDRKHVYRELAGAICRAFEGRLGKDRERLERLLGGEGGAYARLRSYVETALNSGDDVLAAWAATCAPAVDIMVPGLRGSYYHGRNFEKLVHERLDRKIDVPDRRFPYPEGRQDEISVRWTGFIGIKKAGKYTFYSASDDGQRLWVDGKQLIDDWNMHGVVEKSGSIDLRPGHHPFKVEFMQGGGGASIKVSWSGPGFGKRTIAGDALMTAPWKGMK